MEKKIFEYAMADHFILLYLTADGDHLEKPEKLHSVQRSQFDPELVEMMADHFLGIPNSITCSGVDYNINEDGVFEGKSFTAKTFQMIWSISDEDSDRLIKHREDGPAMIEFSEFQTSHDKDGNRTKFYIGGWKFIWYNNGSMRRNSGPYSINGGNIEAVVDPQGNARTVKPIEAAFGWNHPAGGNLTEAAIKATVTKNNIKMNRLSLGASVFENAMEEAIFYSTV